MISFNLERSHLAYLFFVPHFPSGCQASAKEKGVPGASFHALQLR